MKKTYKFFEFIARMGNMLRWSLMRNVKQEDLKQHSYDVAVIAHALATIWNEVFGPQHNSGFEHIDANQAATYALFHDTAEVFTGDIPTPIKNFGGGKGKEFADILEAMAVNKMITSLPEELMPAYRRVFDIPLRYKGIVKAADRISALKKCREEIAAGNNEFLPAAARIEEVLKKSNLPEVHYFMEHFMPSRPMSLDELIEGNGSWLLDEEDQ
jgi:5'-deoxynucleotidase